MGRNRRMPPLFEVMRQTNPAAPPGAAGNGGASGGASAGAPTGPGPAAPAPAGSGDTARNQFFRRTGGPSQPETAGNAALRLTPPHTEGDEELRAPAAPVAPPAAPPVNKPVEVRVGQARRNWVVQDTDSGDGDDSSSGSGRTPGPKSPVAIPGMWLAAGAAIALSLLVIVWIVAYRQGSSAKETEFQGKLSSSAPSGPSTPTKQPAANPAPNGGSNAVPPEHRPAREPDPRSAPAKPDSGSSKPPQQTPPAAPVAGDPAPSVDPRQAETNYLSLLTFREKADAVELAKYLTSGGVASATMPLKSSGGSSVGWEVFVLQGIPSAEFRRADETRNGIHRKLEELGRKWNQEGRSRLNLSRDNVTWRKFKPGS